MRIILVLLGVFVFSLLIVARLPLSLAASHLPDSVSYQGVSGTLWNGRIEGLKVKDETVGDAVLGLRFLPLLTGRAEAGLALEGRRLAGTGAVSVKGDLVVIEDAVGRADLAQFGLVDVFGQIVRGEVTFDIDRVTYSLTQGCRDAALTLRTDALAQSLGVYGGEGLDLEGQGRCAGSDILIPMQAANDDARIDVELRVQPGGRYLSRLAVTPEAPEFGTYLEAAGFKEQNGTWVAERSGRLEAAL